jgi:hypothetical protein
MTIKETKDTTIHNAPKKSRETAVTLPIVTPPGLPLYLAAAVWAWDQKIPEMETKDVPKTPPPVAVYLAEDVEAQRRTPDRWKQTVITALVTAGLYVPAHDDDPRKALNDLLVNNALPLPHDLPEPVEESIPVEPVPEPESRRR